MSIHHITGKIFSFLKVVFPLILLTIAIIEIRNFAIGLDVQLLKAEMAQIQLAKLGIYLIITICAIFPMFFYDRAIVKLLKLQVPAKRLVKQSLIVNSFSNLLGFGGLVGVTLRSYFYRSDTFEKGKVIKTIAIVSLFFLSGISLLAWTVVVNHKHIPLLVNVKWLYFAVIIVGIYLPLLFLLSFRKTKKNNEPIIPLSTRLFLILVSIFEWLAIFLAIWLLSSMLNISVPILDLFFIFIISSCAGVVSLIPGGLGSFDLVFIWGTGYLGIGNEKIIVLLILYRIGYFMIPFIIGAFLFIKEYWQKWNQAWGNVPNVIVQRVSHSLLTISIFISGLVLLLSAALPGVMERVKIAETIVSLPIISLSHQLSVATGFILLGLSRGIQYKVKRAYHLTIIVLSLAALLSLSKGFDYEEAIFLLVVAILLRISKARFYRESYVLTWGKMVVDLATIFVITTMYILIGYFNLPTAKINIPARIIPYIITDYQDLFFSAFIGLLIAIFILILGYYIGKSKKWIFESSKNQEQKIYEHINKHSGNVLTHLIFLHDKYVFWNKKENVLFPFQMYADKIIVLGDLVGDRTEYPNAIEEFMSIADLYGYTPVFYEVSNIMLPTLHEHGFDFFKLGEEAFVDLKDFTFTGKKMKGARAIKNKFERENFTFEIISPPFDAELLGELRNISDDWLAGRKEKGFSLGFFNEDYLNKSNVAILKDEKETLIGFTSLMPVYDNDQIISVDLMRFKPGSPPGTMDFIFFSLFEWAKENNYIQFNLGMAPLSNVGMSKFSFFSEKVAAQIFLHGQFFYHFQGLRKFKEKFNVIWKPKYLAYRRKSSLPITMAQVALMIGKGKNVHRP